MLMMVTSRRVSDGEYGDEEQSRYGYDYLYQYTNGAQGGDGFDKRGKRGFEMALLSELNRLKQEEGVGTPKVGIYLHGYNNHYQDSIDELVDLHQALSEVVGYAPVLVGFSWPSSGATIDYLADREEVRDSVPAFVRFLLDINTFLVRNERKCFSTSYCIAHSMGNYLLRKGMEYLSDYLGSPEGRMMFSETVMLAPDIASKDIEIDGKGQYIADFSRRVHVYYSKYDRALKASSAKRFGANRLGRHGAEDYTNLADNVVVVDASNFANPDGVEGLKARGDEDVSVHSASRYHPRILKDIEQVLSSYDRGLIPRREEIVPETEHWYRRNHYRLV
ncbi:MAG: alpha/beta hydrolase [Proteobacteria bacterium]|jgi:esterase/lipase superfamily enzyme|nr:alpha/beta hydrolase [Pseudomonadota bacterium]MCG6936522.1 alpha/beta hydrolase [Pseudomonadota bacterium]